MHIVEPLRGRVAAPFKAVLVAACVLAWMALSSTVAWGATPPVFDPVLSLTGGTGTSAADEVPDPGLTHPPRAFDDPCGVVTDSFGNIYVTSGASASQGAKGRVDIFNAQGEYLTGFADPRMPCRPAVDSEGNLYVTELERGEGEPTAVVLFVPSSYPPTAATTYSGPTTIATGPQGFALGAAVDPSNDHLYVSSRAAHNVTQFDSAANGSTFIPPVIGQEEMIEGGNLDVYGANHDVYVNAALPSDTTAFRSFIFDGGDASLKQTVDGSCTKAGGFDIGVGARAGIAVDQATGNFYVGDIPAHRVVVQFDSSGNCLSEFEHSFQQSEPNSDIAVDNGAFSPNQGYVYVTSGNSLANSHLYAFEPPPPTSPPELEGEVASQVGARSATLEARIDPNGKATRYHFEYGTAACAVNPCSSVPVPDASAGSGSGFIKVSRPITGLQPDTTYHFRVVAENCEGEEQGSECETEGEDRTFRTFPTQATELPDGRAYELVTPSDTNGRVPTANAIGRTNANGFDVSLATPDGESVVFGLEGGAVGGGGGNGYLDMYRAIRGPSSWQTISLSPSGAQSQVSFPGSPSPDHLVIAWRVLGEEGTLADPVKGEANYFRLPDGSFEPIGMGSLGVDPTGSGRYVSAGAHHIIFVTGTGILQSPPVQLEPNAPPSPINTVYDRTPGGPTQVVSLLPGNVAPSSDATYLGVSADGSDVAFEVEGTIYLRIDNSRTVEVAAGGADFAGVSRDGTRVFYLDSEKTVAPQVPAGRIFAFDAKSEETTEIGGAESVLVNVSDDGSHAYFISPLVLSGEEENSQGQQAEAGKGNLYGWSAQSGQARFVATVLAEDVAGEETEFQTFVEGLGLWVANATGHGVGTGPASVGARTTPDGRTLLFESVADLTAYASDGRREIYRYEEDSGSLLCVSCSPIGATAASDAQFRSHLVQGSVFGSPVNAISHIANVTDDGKAVFFQSGDRLVPRDENAVTDVYEWRAQGSGACGREGGCLALISSGRSSAASYLYAMTPDGHDVFFRTSDVLVQQDLDETPSIYDARVGGGFPVSSGQLPCQGDACQGGVAASPPAVPMGSAAFQGPGNRKAQAKKHWKKKRHRKRSRHGKHGRRAKHQKHSSNRNARADR